MSTALSLVAQDLSLTPEETRFLLAMLQACPAPAARSGELPMKALEDIIASDLKPSARTRRDLKEILRDEVGAILSGLLSARRCALGDEQSKTIVSFSLLQEYRMSRVSGDPVKFHFNSQFLLYLAAIAEARGISLF